MIRFYKLDKFIKSVIKEIGKRIDGRQAYVILIGIITALSLFFVSHSIENMLALLAGCLIGGAWVAVILSLLGE